MTAQFKYLDTHYDTICHASHLDTTIDIIDLRLKAALDVRTTFEGLRESVKFTREYIAKMKEQQS